MGRRGRRGGRGARFADARGRLVLRALDHLVGRRGGADRHGRVRRRPPPGLGGEPGRVGPSRPRGRRPAVDKMDTLPFFRAAIHDAGLEASVLAIVGRSPTVAATWTTPLSFLFIDGGHGEEPARPTTRGGRRTWPWVARWRSTTCSPTRPTAAGRRTSRSSCRRWSPGGSGSSRPPVHCASLQRVD